MTGRRVIAAGVLVLIMSACGSTPGAPPPPTTPEAVASQFATAFASGDTPTACALAGGNALQHMTNSGWCQHSPGWSTGYWRHDHCQMPANELYAAMSFYDYRTNTPVDRFTDFVIGVTADLKVTYLGANPGGTDDCAGFR